MFGSNCCFLTHIQVSQEKVNLSGTPCFEEFSIICCDPQGQDFSVVSEVKLNVFLEFPCFLHDPMNIGNLISGSSAFSKLDIFLNPVFHMLLKP